MRISEILCEMIIRSGNRGQDNQVIAFNDSIWLFDYGNDDEAVLQDIARRTGIEADSFEDVMSQIRDYRHDVLVGYIHDDLLYLSGIDTEPYAESSPLVRKVVIQLGLHGVAHERMSYEGHEYKEEFPKHRLLGDIPEIAYHGTSSKHIRTILRSGLRPNRNANWTWETKFEDLIFLTANRSAAYFHANKQAEDNNAMPIVIATRIPDRAKITIDYDVARRFHGRSDRFDKLGYTASMDQFPHNEFDAVATAAIQKYNPKRDFTKSTGLFAYKGAILPSFFTGFYAALSEAGAKLGEEEGDVEFTSAKDLLDGLDVFQEFGYYDPSLVYSDDDDGGDEDED